MIKALIKYIILAVAILLLSFFIFISTTTPGAKLIFSIASQLAPGTLNFQAISGALNRTVTINSINYKNNSIVVTGDAIKFHIQLLALILNELRINSLQAKHLKIQLLDVKPSSKPTETPEFSLPIKLKLSNLHLQNFTLIKAKQSYQLQNFNLNSLIKSNTIDIIHLQTTYQKNDYLAQGTIKFRPINFNLNVQIAKQQNILFSTKIQGYGDWKKLIIKTHINTPAKVEASLTLHNILDHLSWQLIGNLQNFSAQQYDKSIDYQHITGTFNGNGDNKQANFLANIVLDKRVPKSNITFQLESKDLLAKRFIAQLKWQNISLPNSNTHNINSLQGKLQLNGTLNNYHINSNIDFNGSKIPTGNLQLTGNGKLKQLNLTQITIKTLNGNISGKLNLNWQPQLSYQAQFIAQHLQPQKKWADWPGDINFTSKIKGSANKNRIELNNLHGSLREQDLNGQAKIQWLNEHVDQALLKLSLGKAKAIIDLKRNGYLQANWNIDIPDLAKTTPFGNGKLNTKSRLSTTQSLPIVSGYINGKNLAWLNYQVGVLNSQFTFNLNSEKNSNVQLTANQLKLPNYNFSTINFTGVGNKNQQRLKFNIITKNKKLAIKALSQYQNKEWQFNFSQFSLFSAQEKTWHLEHPFVLNYANNLLSLKNFSWQNNLQRLNANFIWKNHTLQQGQLNLHQVALSLFNLFIPNNIHLQGNLDVEANYHKSNNNITAKAQAKIEKIKIRYLLQGKEQTFNIDNGSLQTNLKQQKLNTQLNLKFPEDNYLNLSLEINPFELTRNFTNKQTSYGNLTAHLSKLNFLSLFFPQIESINGVANINLKWNGTLKVPHLTGYANLEKATAVFPVQNLQLRNIQLKTTARNNQVNYQLQAESGDGKLIINGVTYLNNTYKTELNLSGNNFTVINTPQYQINASPELKLMVNNRLINLTGDISLPSMLINQTNYQNIVGLPNEVIITDSKQNNKAFSFLDKLHTRIRLILGKNIQFKNDHLNAQLSGSLVLMSNPQTTTHANGQLTITKGAFTVFGQTLNIEDGKLIYVGGPTTNPGLNIKATKTIHTFVSPTQNSLLPTNSTISQQINIPLQQKTVIVGVSVTGTLNNPDIILFSDDPGLSQADILSYLILGFPVDNASNQQAQALLHALNALSANNSNTSRIINQFKQTFNLDQIGLQSNTYLNPKTNTVKQNTSLVLGKILSPKLFVRYSIGLIEPINTLSTAYQFNQHWSAQAQSNNLGSGIDLTYSWEQN